MVDSETEKLSEQSRLQTVATPLKELQSICKKYESVVSAPAGSARPNALSAQAAAKAKNNGLRFLIMAGSGFYLHCISHAGLKSPNNSWPAHNLDQALTPH